MVRGGATPPPFLSPFALHRFSRAIRTDDGPGEEDKDLDGNYFMMFGAVDAGGLRTDQSDVYHQLCPSPLIAFSNESTSVSYHVAQNPYISTTVINLTNSSGSATPTFGTTGSLTRVHGILMIAAWPMMATTSIFFAAWMRPALPASVGFLVRITCGCQSDHHFVVPLHTLP